MSAPLFHPFCHPPRFVHWNHASYRGSTRSFSIFSPSAIRRTLPLTFSFDIGVPAFAWTTGTPGEMPEVFNLEILESEITMTSTQKRDGNLGISCVRFIFTSCIPLSDIYKSYLCSHNEAVSDSSRILTITPRSMNIYIRLSNFLVLIAAIMMEKPASLISLR